MITGILTMIMDHIECKHFSKPENSGYIAINFFTINMYGETNCLEFVKVLSNNNIQLSSSVKRNFLIHLEEDLKEVTNMNGTFWFDIYKDEEEMIDFICGNSWPIDYQEFMEMAIHHLTKEKI